MNWKFLVILINIYKEEKIGKNEYPRIQLSFISELVEIKKVSFENKVVIFI